MPSNRMLLIPIQVVTTSTKGTVDARGCSCEWEGGEVKKCPKVIFERDTGILALVADYESRKTLSLLKR